MFGTVLKIFLWVLAALAAVSIAASVGLFIYACRRPKRLMDDAGGAYAQYVPQIKAGAAWFEVKQPETEIIHSFDGLRLAASVLECPDARAAVVLMHGFHSSGTRDFGCALEYYYSLGFNIILPDQRANGKSDGGYITYGVRESRDCRDWARYAAKRWGTLPIVLDGVSLGASTVLMAAGLELPASVKCIVADCGFTSPCSIMKHVLRRDFHLPAFPVLYIARLLTRLIARFDMDESTLDAMKKCSVPILFVHGTGDTFVPCEMSKENYEACASDKELLLVEGAGHALSWLVDNEKYVRVLRAFFDRWVFGVQAEL